LRLLLSPEAEEDFRALVEHIAERSPAAAAGLGEQILTVIDHLAAGDFDGPEQRLTTGDVVRSWPVPPLRIYYQRRDDALWILRIYHQARRPITQ
jgi:plasmid stabilization system protein ParE